MSLKAAQVGYDLMDPYADDIHHVPMTAICRTIEIDLPHTLGEPAPGKIAPRLHVLC